MLHSNPGDYAWGQSGLDAIVTQVSAAQCCRAVACSAGRVSACPGPSTNRPSGSCGTGGGDGEGAAVGKGLGSAAVLLLLLRHGRLLPAGRVPASEPRLPPPILCLWGTELGANESPVIPIQPRWAMETQRSWFGDGGP